MHALLEGKYELGWLPADQIKVGDLLIKGDNCVRKVLEVVPPLGGYLRFGVARADGTVLLGDWEVRQDGGCMVLRDVTPPPLPECEWCEERHLPGYCRGCGVGS